MFKSHASDFLEWIGFFKYKVFGDFLMFKIFPKIKMNTLQFDDQNH